jgi:Na+-transporting methylmalonyl-CoA/oxaloacetate decarboxylase gamma subunit
MISLIPLVGFVFSLSLFLIAVSPLLGNVIDSFADKRPQR